MRLSKNKYDEIDRKVYQLLMDFNPTGFPFDVVLLAEWMGFKIYSFSSLSEQKRDYLLSDEKTSTGLHICDRRMDKPVFWIFYNDDVEKGRWYYTIGHEIGHIVLGHGSNPTLEQEVEADYFAKQLMAPRCLVVAKNMKSPKEIHSHFCLSWEAANYLSESVERIVEKNAGNRYENDTEFLSWCEGKGWLEKQE